VREQPPCICSKHALLLRWGLVLSGVLPRKIPARTEVIADARALGQRQHMGSTMNKWNRSQQKSIANVWFGLAAGMSARSCQRGGPHGPIV